MKPLFAAAAGAAVAAAVVVSLYEGKVVVVNGGAATTLAAGEQASVEGAAAPVRQPAGPSATSALAAPLGPSSPPGPGAGEPARGPGAAREAESRQQIAALQARVQQLEAASAALARKPPATGEAAPPGDEDLPPRAKTHDFSAGELKAMAQHCEVRVDMPQLDGPPWGAREAKGLHLAGDQQEQVAAAVNKVREEAIAQLRALYVEATGDTGGAQSLAPTTLGQELLHKSRPAEVDAARARVARERAGLEQPPADAAAGTIPERYFRYLVTIGDSVQHGLEPIVGAVQAGEIRDRVDGARLTMNGCKDGAR